jgi:hypothetical protein
LSFMLIPYGSRSERRGLVSGLEPGNSKMKIGVRVGCD